MTISRRSPTDISGAKPCPVQPVQRGLSSWSYPWEHMEPGHYFSVPDASPKARSRISSAASAWCKRNPGVRIGTLAKYADSGRQDGWWCIRYDGCVVEVPMTVEEYKQSIGVISGNLTEQGAKRKATRRRTLRPPKMARLTPLGTHAPEVAQPLEEGDYSDWSKPVPPEEYV